MSRKRQNPYKNFMVFHAVLFFAVIFVTALFLYLAYSLKRKANKAVTYEGRYLIEMSTDFSGEDLSIYVNDSLLLNGIMPGNPMTLDINRFAEESVLMIVDNATDAMIPFSLDKKGCKISVKKKEGKIIFEEQSSSL